MDIIKKTLKNGLNVVNFNSINGYKFDTGESIDGVKYIDAKKRRAKRLQINDLNKSKFTTMKYVFYFPNVDIVKEIKSIQEDKSVDIILVSPEVFKAWVYQNRNPDKIRLPYKKEKNSKIISSKIFKTI